MTASGDADLQTLLIQSVPNLRAFANSLCGDPTRADDLVQDTLVKAWSNLPSFEQGTNLRAWLFTILRNTYFSNLRKLKREVEDADGVFSERLSILPSQQSHMDMLDFKEAFKGLTDDQKEVLLLVGAEGFSYEEAAEITGCAIGTVKSRVNRARGALAKSLALDEGEDHASAGEFAAVLQVASVARS